MSFFEKINKAFFGPEISKNPFFCPEISKNPFFVPKILKTRIFGPGPLGMLGKRCEKWEEPGFAEKKVRKMGGAWVRCKKVRKWLKKGAKIAEKMCENGRS